MRVWRSKKYIDRWYTLTPSQKKTLRLINRRRHFREWEEARQNSDWALFKDLLLASILLLAVVEILMYLIYLLGKVIGF